MRPLRNITTKMISSSTLQKIGLNEKHQRFYMAALELGRASITHIAAKSGLKRPTAYLVADELIKMGLLSTTRVGKRLLYSAAHPSRLQEMAKALESRIAESLPELLALYNTPKNKPKIQVFEGVKGVKLLYQEIFEVLKKGDEVLWFARIDALYDFEPELVKGFQEILEKVPEPHCRELQVLTPGAKRWSKEFKPLIGSYYQVRWLSPEFEFGFTDNAIFGNKLAIFSLKEGVFVIVIESEEIVKTFRAMYEWAWKMGKAIQDGG